MDQPIDLDQLPVSSWYPGHMLKAGRRMRERLNLVDLVVELLDARLPASSQNNKLRNLCRNKPKCRVFAKSDLADPDAMSLWQARFLESGQPSYFIDSTTGSGLEQLVPAWRSLVFQRREKNGATRPLMRPVRVMIVGIPNVGKSTLINRLSASRKAQVGPKPGVTRDQQWISLQGDIELLDTPGVLWPKIQSKRMELKLGLVGTLPEDLADPELMAEYLHEWALAHPGSLDLSTYDLHDLPAAPEDLVTAVGVRRGLLKSGGIVDTARSALTIVKDFRAGRLGRVVLDDLPDETCAG